MYGFRKEYSAKVIGITCLGLSLLFGFIALSGLFPSMRGEEVYTLVVAILCLIGGIMLLALYFFGPEDWNSLSFEEKCQRMANQLKTGKRKWYLTPDNGGYLATPLSRWNMNEMGGGQHISVRLDDVKHHLKNGLIKNDSLVHTILKFLEQK